MTKQGNSWFKESGDNPVSKKFAKLKNNVDFESTGVGFYWLRHTFATIADETKDRPAVWCVMGHCGTSTLDEWYIQDIDDSRLEAVAEHVRSWLLDGLSKNVRKRFFS